MFFRISFENCNLFLMFHKNEKKLMLYLISRLHYKKKKYIKSCFLVI